MTEFAYNFLNNAENVEKFLEANGCKMLKFNRNVGPIIDDEPITTTHTSGVFCNRSTNREFEWDCYIDSSNHPFLTLIRIVREREYPESMYEFTSVINDWDD